MTRYELYRLCPGTPLKARKGTGAVVEFLGPTHYRRNKPTTFRLKSYIDGVHYVIGVSDILNYVILDVDDVQVKALKILYGGRF